MLKSCADSQRGHRNTEENENQHRLKYREDAASQEESESSSDGAEQVVDREWIVLGHLGSNSKIRAMYDMRRAHVSVESFEE